MYLNMATRLALVSAIMAVLLVCLYSRPHCVPATPAVAVVAAPAAPAPPLEIESTGEEKVRQVARDFVKETVPGSKTDGVFLLPFGMDNVYLAGVDTTVAGNGATSRWTCDLLVREYVRKNGSTYWRAERLGPDEAARIRLQGLAR